jgi:glucan phosphoethanolaminetransferase (alkaline phosphatase superfamily)
MDTNFFKYLQQLEVMAFFSGFPLVYAIVIFGAGYLQKKPELKKKLITLLPYTYAIVGTLFIGLQIRNLYPNYDFENIKNSISYPFLFLWACLSILFYLPVINKRTVLSLIHSLVFFFILLKDLFINKSQVPTEDKSIIRNDMKIYTDSLLLNAGIYLITILILFFLIPLIKKLKTLRSDKIPTRY